MTIEAAAAVREALPTIELGLPGWTLRSWRRGDAQALARHAGNAEVGWWLAEQHWGHGVATRVARALVERAFADPDITRVFAPIHAGNPRSMRVAEKSGFVLEGVQRQGAVKAGQVIDCWVFARYRPA